MTAQRIALGRESRTAPYDEYALSMTIKLVKEIIEMIEVIPAQGKDGERRKRFNINRAYAAIDNLKRIEL